MEFGGDVFGEGEVVGGGVGEVYGGVFDFDEEVDGVFAAGVEGAFGD